MRAISKIAQNWWDYSTLDREILEDAARLSVQDIETIGRPGFTVKIYNSREEFFVAEALEYISVWKEATSSNPVGICGPIGPTEQLPLVAQMVNDLDMSLKHTHFWGMDEWVIDGVSADSDHPLSFARADWALCFSRIRKELLMPQDHLHFPSTQELDSFSASFDHINCKIMQGGQGEVKHWAFNDPVRREGLYKDAPPTSEEYLSLGTRVVDLHPLTLTQNARTSSGGIVTDIPSQAVTVGPKETFKSEKISIWHPGWHDNPFGMRLTTLMISQGIVDTSVPMSLLALHPNVQFNFLRSGMGSTSVEMH